MAAEVPAKDVLCEAMEYLSKLGSNLRTRSENLKDKKISREKLNNVLAVQKAANKVLLICELSKKSLENVEIGVRKVLDHIGTSQASAGDGGKTSKTEKDAEIKSKYYYFEYKSRKLRIKKRISLKHYTSVRVLAKSLPKSMIDNYPVHYDCKLYRMRAREKKTQKLKEYSERNNEKDSQEYSANKTTEGDISIISVMDTPTSKSVGVYKNFNTRNSVDDVSIISIPDTPISKKNYNIDIFAENTIKEKRKISPELTKERSHSRDSDQSRTNKKITEIEETNDHSVKKKSKDKINHDEKKKSSEANKLEHRKYSETSNKKEDRKEKNKKVRVIEDSSDEKKTDEDETEKVKENKDKPSKSNGSVSSHEPIDEEKEVKESKDEQSKNNDSDVSCHGPVDEEEFKESKDTPSKNDDNDVSSHEPESKKRKLSVSIDKTQSQGEGNNEVLLEIPDDDETEIDANESVKPIIKCVSLSKLLKPDILVKDKITKPHSKPKDLYITEKKTKPEENKVQKDKQVERSSSKEKEEEEFWVQKRKEVSSFRPKDFVVNVTRLPELSIDYLKKLGLKKITQHGITVCETTDKNNIAEDFPDDQLNNESNKGETVDNLKDNHEMIASKTKRTRKESKSKSDEIKLGSRRTSSNKYDSNDDDDLIAEANKVKNSLLYESDSDDDDAVGIDDEIFKSTVQDAEIVKSSILSVQQNIKGKDSNDVFAQAKKAKNALCTESNSESDKSEPKIATQDKKLKNKHLNKSDSDSEKSSPSFESNSVSSNNEKTTETAAATKSKSEVSEEEESENKESDDKNSNGKDQNDVVKKNDNLSECQRNEKTPEKISSQHRNSDEKAKSSLLNDSSDDKTRTPLSQRLTPQSKKKRMRESMHAKKMLLTYSSSDTEDEQLKNALKEIKDSLLHGSDEEESAKKQKQKRPSRQSSISSDENIIQKVKKKITYDSSSSKEKRVKHKRKTHCKRLDSEDSTKDGNSDSSKSSSSKMVRSKSKPGNSSSQNSDAQDSNDKDIDGLTNLNTLNKSKTRRRLSDATDMTEESSTSNTRRSKLQIKPTGLICEEMLKAESSSDAASASDEEIHDDDDDLPQVTLPIFNGGAEHLVKEDLLGESDSSASQNESANKDDSDSEEKLNARRRKANAISSDSEVGSSRKKDPVVKLSDFEDSDDSEVAKRSKRKKKATDSDASVATTSSNEGGKKKRRRIKSLKDSDVSGSESETEGRNKHGRKNIRKVMGKNQLEEATKKAARQEKERIARIAERQKMYNNLEFDESGKPDEVVLDKVILDFDPETKEPLIEVDRGLVKKLKPHQANGIKFMWDACFESAKRIKKDRGSGCILAHCMGLGKTLQVVTLTHTLLTHGDLTRVNRVLVVCPLSTVLNWVNEFRMWLKYAETEYEVDVYELSRYKQNSERAFQLSQWFQHGGVCVLGYEMFRNLSADNSKKFKKKMLKNFQEALVDPGPDLVVCDEGHLLKNEKTSLSQSMNRVRTQRRIVLTGTPLQNNLKEYYCMVQFVKPNLLGKYNEYLNRFVNPITNGQYTDSTEHDIKIMKRRSHVLHKMLDGAVQRRDYGVLAPFLPPKHEYVLFITLSEVQTKLYQHYLDNFSRRPLPGKSSGFLFPDFQSLQRIWTHPLVLKYNSERYEIMQQKKRDKEEEDSEGSLVDFIDDDSTPDETSTEESSDESADMSDDSRKKSKKKKSAKKSKGKDKEMKGEGGQSRPRRGTRANPIDLGDEEEEKTDDVLEVKNENPTEWWIKLVIEDELDDMRNSHKLVLLFDILRQCETIGDKLLVFSQSLYSLDLIEHFLGKVDEATQDGRIDEKLGGHVGSWSPGIDYFRLDGSTSCENRSIWCKNFNREDNPRARLFLISTRAGGLGINLVAANRVVIFDVSWNPSHDVQSIFRVYRFGQKKPCYVYRFLAMGTMEEKIYERQVTKQAISKRVIDEQQIDRHYAENDLAELYKFEPQPPVPRPIPPLPKDRLFAEMLREHEAQIYKYHEHDSLLENKEEETLSEEERKAAWEDFENEKNKPPPAPFPSPWPMHNGMVPGLLAQQQQQLAYAALAAMLRKDMPNINDTQLRDMLPHIYNANPQMFGGYDYGLMQKMSEIYKYTQPGMMNPGMMNPGVMNAASGAGGMGGMSSASGLQYEPPWQRQQQQQQQMRLQQLMQQQNQMGAKFYAGGLGSRDPVAMALQQQRAREIMLGNTARPRGRPPHAPAPPGHASGDVVNLDSD